jgi:hypothetical protein
MNRVSRPAREPAFDRSLGQHLPSPHRLGNAFERLRAQIVKDEGCPDQLPGQPADHDLVGSGQRFQTRCEIRGLAGDGARLASTPAFEIADDHDTRSDPDMDVKRQFLCRRDRREAGADRLRRIVLLGARPAEISEDTVAEIIGDVPAIALHHSRHRLMIAPK